MCTEYRHHFRFNNDLNWEGQSDRLKSKSLHFELLQLFSFLLKLEMTIFAMGNCSLDETIPKPIQQPEMSMALEVPTTRPQLSFTYKLQPTLFLIQRWASFLSGAQVPVKILSGSKPSNNRLLFQQPSAYTHQVHGVL